MVYFTVAIPTYNGASRLTKVLAKLEKQTGIENISWEIIIVDNNSKDDTAKVVQEYQATWSKSMPGVDLKYFFEPEQGLAFARQRAVIEGTGTWIAFLDDDNWPAEDWIANAYNFAQQYPQAGAVSGQIHGSFEVKPPDNFGKIAAFLAIREHGSTPKMFDPDNLRLPPGAGLVVRKQAWCESVPNRLTLLGRVGKAVVAGEDYEALLYMHKAGWEIWYNPAMHIAHQIPRFRLERDYLIKIAHGIGLATCHLRMINAKARAKPWILLRTFLGNLRRLVKHRLKYGNRVKTELIPAFEMAFYWGSLMSPFYAIATRMRIIWQQYGNRVKSKE